MAASLQFFFLCPLCHLLTPIRCTSLPRISMEPSPCDALVQCPEIALKGGMRGGWEKHLTGPSPVRFHALQQKPVARPRVPRPLSFGRCELPSTASTIDFVGQHLQLPPGAASLLNKTDMSQAR
ncbi:hypothetical protein QBC47DRAFT_378683 [Echria macrotheca]|uniref:Secreted protein n=1 Tax=Echria macrotheca TaxID=438768 RepID=A0AAJ0BHE1_9PEZI|nr:hypothetical protein QBC47DRAFT_378683 [Echria macrotheca]